MTRPSRFLFDNDFGKPRSAVAEAEAAVGAAEAEARGYARGLAQGRAEADSQMQARLADAMNRLALAAAGLLSQVDEADAAREAQALDFAMTLARRIAGDALDAQPLAAIGEAARVALEHLRGVPHLAVRVNDALVEEAEALVRGLARERGYEGRLIVLGEPDMPPGDARLEWADGGIVRDRARIEAAVARALDPPPDLA